MTRRAHPKKQIEAALKEAEAPRWIVMPKHEFTLFLRGTTGLDDDQVERLSELGFDDTSFGSVNGLDYAAFHREAPNLGAALIDAIRALESALPGTRVVGVEGEELVSVAEIARRTGRSRESVRLLIEGRRGPGQFPAAVPWVKAARTRLYDWAEVAAWFRNELGEEVPSDEHTAFISAVNATLVLRRRAEQLDRPEDRRVVAELLEGDLELVRRG